MKKISVVSPCYNEEGNVEELYLETRAVFESLPEYDYEHIFVDNDSTDQTVKVLKNIALKDPRVKIIVNARNFGAIRSTYYGLLQAYGDAVVLQFSDLQDPPALISDFIREWEKGYKVVKGIKTSSEESSLFYLIRTLYYFFIAKVAEVKLTGHFTGFGLYDQEVIEILRKLDDPYPYLRGIISELGIKSSEVSYRQKQRKRGISSNNIYRLYDYAMLGITSHSKVPLRLATMLGFALSLLSLLVALGYLIAKLLFWDYFPLGTAPIMVGLFLLASVQLFFIGIIGEYIGLMHMRILKRPLVVERERINFY
ncbi:MAG: glycosyltransferase family 2 protein [Microcystis aeruginosa W13-18]|jgi:glycosyltransferase involved in cell wall biosynthesis|nr:glycosyltransferase family 2 protein [Microcystis aeruginosa W13-18]NCR35937.1 glycosyltransferase family 2 protein [Microcystis aeruginosa S11-05]NCR49428.1 glycosyltransferase family 2 protein [Microcystis aeruginosa S11-01]